MRGARAVRILPLRRSDTELLLCVCLLDKGIIGAFLCASDQASFIRAILQWGGVWVGGSSAGWVGLKLWTPPPSYNSEGFLGWAPATPSFFGHRSLVWLFAGAPFCCVVAQAAGVNHTTAGRMVTQPTLSFRLVVRILGC